MTHFSSPPTATYLKTLDFLAFLFVAQFLIHFKAMMEKDTPRILLATLTVGVVWLYFMVLFLLEESIGGRYIGAGLIVASLPIVSLFFFLIRYCILHGMVSSKQILNITLSLFFSLGTLLFLDIAYSIYLNFRTSEKPHIENSRQIDPAFATGELEPRMFFPADQNFQLNKPNYMMSGAHYGQYYSPELMRSPTLRKSVFNLHQFSFSIDQHGFRNTKPLGQADIFALGDSFTFGYAIDAGKSWVGLLENAIELQ